MIGFVFYKAHIILLYISAEELCEGVSSPNRAVKAFGSVLDATCNEKCRPCSLVKSSQRVNETADLPLPMLVPSTNGNRKFIRKNEKDTNTLDSLIVLSPLLSMRSVWFPAAARQSFYSLRYNVVRFLEWISDLIFCRQGGDHTRRPRGS